MTDPSPERQDLEHRLATLVEMARRMPEDAELAALIRVVRNNLAAHEASPETNGQRLINTVNLADHHIQRRRRRPGP